MQPVPTAGTSCTGASCPRCQACTVAGMRMHAQVGCTTDKHLLSMRPSKSTATDQPFAQHPWWQVALHVGCIVRQLKVLMNASNRYDRHLIHHRRGRRCASLHLSTDHQSCEHCAPAAQRPPTTPLCAAIGILPAAAPAGQAAIAHIRGMLVLCDTCPCYCWRTTTYNLRWSGPALHVSASCVPSLCTAGRPSSRVPTPAGASSE